MKRREKLTVYVKDRTLKMDCWYGKVLDSLFNDVVVLSRFMKIIGNDQVVCHGGGLFVKVILAKTFYQRGILFRIGGEMRSGLAGEKPLVTIHHETIEAVDKEGIIILVHTRSALFPAWKVEDKEALEKHYWQTGEVLESALVPREEWPEEIVRREKELGIDGFRGS